MAKTCKNLEIEKMLSCSDDLIQCLKFERDHNNLRQCLEQSKILQSKCDTDSNHLLSLIQDYQKEIDVCKQKTDAAKSEAASDSEIDMLQKELEKELQRESLLKDELRDITNDINDLESQRVSIEERRKSLRKLEKDDARSQMKLSMYASVTNIIPKLDEQFKVAGHIVEREEKVIQNFEFDPQNMTSYDTCNCIWKMINL